ncbi:MAG TPA: ATP-binding cassette domain-containing protein, partial [SAR86 cluster bacterium]|nr:ATP-binding cassette domain-containing protein [SAR86 cluster bacterium]
MEREFAVKAKGVIKSYDNSRALDGIDLEVRSGQVLGLIGPNGAGKSTFLQAVLGLLN